MSSLSQETVTRLLIAVREGDQNALNALFPRVYDELRHMAHQQRRGWHGDNTLNTTALVHEAFLKMADKSQLHWTSRGHFFAVTAKTMRHILIDYAEARRAKKRGGHLEKMSLEEEKALAEALPLMMDDEADMLVALGEALKKLEGTNERHGKVVECKFFGKMTNKETAEAVGISESQIKRDWKLAQAWLHREMNLELEKWVG